MQTRFSSIVRLKKSAMEKSEQALQKANANLNSAKIALQISYEALENISAPQAGSISLMIASRTILSTQRAAIEHNKEWVAFAQSQAKIAQKKLQMDTIEYEKYHYLEVQEIKKIQLAISKRESKDLDEIALLVRSKGSV